MLRCLRGLLLPALGSLLLAEAGARAALMTYPLFRRIEGTDESSRRLAFVHRHARTRGRPLPYRFDVYDPERGWAVAPGVRDMPVFDNKILSSNSRGLRGKLEYPYARVPGKRRIVVLGDSYTFGDEVSDHETYASVLAGLLPNTEVLNLGVHGYGHDQMLLYYTGEGVKYRPDVVILGYVWFDQERNLLAFNDFAKPKFELTTGGLRLTNVPVPTPQAVLAQEWLRPKLADLFVMARGRMREALGRDRGRAQPVTSAILDGLLEAVQATGAVPVLVYLPVLREVMERGEDLTPNELELDRYCRGREVVCLFLRPRFREAVAGGAVFNTRRHWKPPEHAIAARAIRDLLTERGLLTTPDTGLAVR